MTEQQLRAAVVRDLKPCVDAIMYDIPGLVDALRAAGVLSQ